MSWCFVSGFKLWFPATVWRYSGWVKWPVGVSEFMFGSVAAAAAPVTDTQHASSVILQFSHAHSLAAPRWNSSLATTRTAIRCGAAINAPRGRFLTVPAAPPWDWLQPANDICSNYLLAATLLTLVQTMYLYYILPTKLVKVPSASCTSAEMISAYQC